MSLLKKTIAIASLAATCAPALAEVEANIGATSNYLWRGVSQSNNAASVNGGLDYSHESGFYAGTWVGSLGDDDSGFNGAETDLYLGFGGDISEDVSYDVGYIYYLYSEQDDADFSEIYASVAVSAFEAGVSYTVDSQVNETAAGADVFIDGDIYYYVSAAFDIDEDYSASLTIGQYSFDEDGVAGAEPDYTHYQLDVTKATESMGDFTFTVSSTDADENDIMAVASDDTNVVVSWSTSL